MAGKFYGVNCVFYFLFYWIKFCKDAVFYLYEI